MHLADAFPSLPDSDPCLEVGKLASRFKGDADAADATEKAGSFLVASTLLAQEKANCFLLL